MDSPVDPCNPYPSWLRLFTAIGLIVSGLMMAGFPGGPLLTSGVERPAVQQRSPDYELSLNGQGQPENAAEQKELSLIWLPLVHTQPALAGDLGLLLKQREQIVLTPQPEETSPPPAEETSPPPAEETSPPPAEETSPLPTVESSPPPPSKPNPPPAELAFDGVVRQVQVPILMYHYVSVPPPNADIYRLDLSVTPDRFATHLLALSSTGYTTISLYDLLAHLTQGTPLPQKPVILSFDDGYRDNYENAFPLLQEFGMTATFFVVTDYINEGLSAYLTWEMAREMQAAGMHIESHARTHVDLRNRKDSFLIWQALGSVETIESELGMRPRFITYPSGHYDANTIRIFKDIDFWAGLTTIQGATHSTDNLFQLKRVRVPGTTTGKILLQLLAKNW